mmetsp:Transcript_11103/g.12474  ORF Transcript_11103/g.12474 Transcript_11103/m.12474 type:complete len:108 (-) Transcript_11103:241-564(-)
MENSLVKLENAANSCLLFLNLTAIVIELLAASYFIFYSYAPTAAGIHLILISPSALYHLSEDVRTSFLYRFFAHTISVVVTLALFANLFVIIFDEGKGWDGLVYFIA